MDVWGWWFWLVAAAANTAVWGVAACAELRWPVVLLSLWPMLVYGAERSLDWESDTYWALLVVTLCTALVLCVLQCLRCCLCCGDFVCLQSYEQLGTPRGGWRWLLFLWVSVVGTFVAVMGWDVVRNPEREWSEMQPDTTRVAVLWPPLAAASLAWLGLWECCRRRYLKLRDNATDSDTDN